MANVWCGQTPRTRSVALAADSLAARALVVLIALLIGSSACSDNGGADVPGDGSVQRPPVDAGGAPELDGNSGADAGGSDAGGTDAGEPPGDVNPFPSDPKGGEFAWVVSAAGAGDPVSAAADAAGNIFVVATQTGVFAMGSVHVDAPTGTEALLVLKLTADGAPIWARAFNSAGHVNARAIATTAAGNVVVGGVFNGATLLLGDVLLTNAGLYDGFVVALDGSDGSPQWTKSLATLGDDAVAGIAIGPDAGGMDAVYVFGAIGGPTTIGGQAVSETAALIRYDDDGAQRWVKGLAAYPGFDRALAMDPQRGPVIVAGFAPGALGTEPPAVGGNTVVGLDPDGQIRFARPVMSNFTPDFRSLAVAPTGDVYLASNADYGTTVVDGHAISYPADPVPMFWLHLTPDGHYAASNVVAGYPIPSVLDVAADTAGASYMTFECHGKVNVEPEIACEDGEPGGVIVSYGPDNSYRWATYVGPAFVESIVPVAGNRLIVAGQSLAQWTGGITNFGGVKAASQQLFIGSLAGGLARLPSPLPAAPVITSAAVLGASDGQVREGGSATLVLAGSALDHVASARLGDIDIHVPPSAGSSTKLQLSVFIPHGHAPGSLPLTVSNAGGSALIAGLVTVTPVVVSPSGTSIARGTFSAPLSLCNSDSLSDTLRYGDVLQIRAGDYACTNGIGIPSGVTVRGDAKTNTMIHGTGFGSFDGFHASAGIPGPSKLERLTIASARGWAISTGASDLTVSDVDISDSAGGGLDVEGGHVTLTNFRYLRSKDRAIAINGGSVDATGLSVDSTSTGILVEQGSLNLSDSTVTAAVVAGDDRVASQPLDPRAVTIARTTLGSYVLGRSAHLLITDSTFAAQADRSDGIVLFGGDLTMTGTAIQGCTNIGIRASALLVLGSPGAMPAGATSLITSPTVSLDRVEIVGCKIGIVYDAFNDASGQLIVRRSHVQSQEQALRVFDLGSAADLGTTASPGDNRLETTSGAPALDDERLDGVAIDAHGTTLNGASFEGDVVGPADATGSYHLAGTTTIRF
jgi:hypothetical protein